MQVLSLFIIIIIIYNHATFLYEHGNVHRIEGREKTSNPLTI